ncbi:MAG: hypothetical protein WCR45_08655 [Bacteroidaceae bacterium]
MAKQIVKYSEGLIGFVYSSISPNPDVTECNAERNVSLFEITYPTDIDY